MSHEKNGEPELAAPASRLMSVIVDGIVVVVVGIMLGVVAGGTLAGLVTGFSAAEELGAEDAAAVGAVGGLLGSFLGAALGPFFMQMFLMVCEGLSGKTPGKMLLSLRVANADRSPASIGSLILRAAVKHSPTWLTLAAVITGVGALGSVSMVIGVVLFFGLLAIFGASRQTLYDMVAGTTVVEA